MYTRLVLVTLIDKVHLIDLLLVVIIDNIHQLHMHSLISLPWQHSVVNPTSSTAGTVIDIEKAPLEPLALSLINY